MYAIIATGGKQYRVEPGDIIDVERIKNVDDGKITFGEILAISDDKDVQVGTPTINGATVSASLVEERRSKKVVVFKMKRRKGYRRKGGHRQQASRVKILEINQ